MTQLDLRLLQLSTPLACSSTAVFKHLDWQKVKYCFSLVTTWLTMVRLLRLESQEFVSTGCKLKRYVLRPMRLIFPICSQANILDILRTYPYPMPAHTNVIGANPLPPIAGAHPGSLCAKRNRHLSNTSQRHKSYSYPGIKHHFSRFGHETQGPSTSISHRSTLNDIWSLRAAEGFLGVLNGGSTSRTNSCAERNVW